MPQNTQSEAKTKVLGKLLSFRSKGFTLVELLVAISIIGLMSSITLVSLNSARAQSRDAKRITEIDQLQTALELYFDQNGTYPPINNASTSKQPNGCGQSGSWCDLETELSSFMNPIPRDPLGLQNDYRIFYDSDSNTNYDSYGIMARLEHGANFSLTVNDGGYYLEFYEVGIEPTYCSRTYSGNGADWLTANSKVCQGGD